MMLVTALYNYLGPVLFYLILVVLFIFSSLMLIMYCPNLNMIHEWKKSRDRKKIQNDINNTTYQQRSLIVDRFKQHPPFQQIFKAKGISQTDHRYVIFKRLQNHNGVYPNDLIMDIINCVDAPDFSDIIQ